MNTDQEHDLKNMKALMANMPDASKLSLNPLPIPLCSPDQSLIKVAYFSLNPDEVRTALNSRERYVPGWDFAGTVVTPAADGRSPGEGTPVFGVVPRGSWAGFVAVRTGLMAEIPAGVSAAEAAALPVAGVTALACLETAGALLGRKVLITGASGGLGRFACQLAHIAGAQLYAISRRGELPALLEEDGVAPVQIFNTMADAAAAGSYDLIIETVGGESLAIALTALSDNGVCASCGNSSGEMTAFDARDFYLMKTNTRLQSVWLGQDIQKANCADKLLRIVDLVARQRLRVPLDCVLPWTQIDEAIRRLLDNKVNGKIVLSVQDI